MLTTLSHHFVVSARPVNMSLVLDFEGFRLGTNNFIIKELAAHAVGDSTYRGRWCFLPPYLYKKLSKRDQFTFSWVTRALHGLDWNFGEIPYKELNSILRVIFYSFQKIYVKDPEKKAFLETFAGRPLESLGACPRFHEILQTVDPCPFFHLTDHPHHCAVKRAATFANHLEKV